MPSNLNRRNSLRKQLKTQALGIENGTFKIFNQRLKLVFLLGKAANVSEQTLIDAEASKYGGKQTITLLFF